MKVHHKEKDYIRSLAEKVATIAADDKNKKVCKRWCDVNALRKPDRYPVWCKPVGAWSELIPQNTLICTDPWLRKIEYRLLQKLKKHEIDDDTPFESCFRVQAVLNVEPTNIWGVDIRKNEPDTPDGAWAYDPPLKNIDDFSKLVLPVYTYNHAETQRELERTDDLLGQILPVKLDLRPPLTPTLGTAAADLRGLMGIMMDSILNPDLLHRLMSFLQKATLSAMKQVEETGLLTLNNRDPMTYSDFIGSSDGKISFKNCWAFANSQEFDQVSPQAWEEFCLNYQKPIFEQFGLVAYGCCENLTHKIEGVLSIPNLRIFVCSPWTDLDKVIKAVGDRHVIMWRQKASDVVFTDDIKKIQQHLEEGLKKLKGCHVQIVLRELQTLGGNLDRLHIWTKLAKEAAAKYS